tara:strand:- start:49513 stop:51318 length:1806 start_codon:yes stop_codon:yes gene_type:complete
LALEIDFTKVRTSWTKYDIVQVMEVVYDLETLKKYKNKEAKINERILRSFLGVDSLEEPIPDYWIKLLEYPNEKNLFALFAIIFTHGDIVNRFAEKYCTGDMKGIFKLEKGKEYTNIRSALIESGAAQPFLRRAEEVPFDFSPIFQNTDVGQLFKSLIEERISRLTREKLSKSQFYEVCFQNNFHKAISLSKTQFQLWLEGKKQIQNSYVFGLKIKNFFSIKEADLSHIEGAKEVYLLGENGDGKSLILMAMYLAFNRFFVSDKTEKEQTGKVIDLLNSRRTSLMELIGIDDRGKEYGNKNVGHLNNLFAYGTHRGRYSTDDAEEYGFMSLFSSEETLTNPITWLRNQMLLEFEKELDSKNANAEIKDLPTSFSIHFLESMFFELLEKNVKISLSHRGIEITEKGSTLSFDQLSEGYKSVIIFVTDLLFRLQSNQPNTRRIEDFYGVVLLDEIDLHLHPKWQRVIVSKLRSLFPNIQFIFTTHSPTIIQGASNDAIIYRVYRNSEDGYTRVSDPYYRKELNHLMINTLLTSPLFGLVDSRLDTENDNSDTNETFLQYRINERISKKLKDQKSKGKEFISAKEIDSMIDSLIDEELGDNDKN